MTAHGLELKVLVDTVGAAIGGPPKNGEVGVELIVETTAVGA